MSLLQVKAFDHITLVVADLERSRNFYVGLLGMQEVPRPAFSFAGSWFQIGPIQIHLILQHEQSGPAGIHVPKHLATTRTHHFAFEIADAAAAEPVLREQGAKIVSPAKFRPDGAVQVFVEDPDGHVVELCTPPK